MSVAGCTKCILSWTISWKELRALNKQTTAHTVSDNAPGNATGLEFVQENLGCIMIKITLMFWPVSANLLDSVWSFGN